MSPPYQASYNRYPDEKGTERHLPRILGCDPCYNRYPDEKGTESRRQFRLLNTTILSYNRYPDEKGTESKGNDSAPMKRGLKVNDFDITASVVTTVTPMKRGLKVIVSIIAR